LKNRYLSFLPTGSSVLPMLLCLPIATVIGVSQTEAVGAQSLGNPEAPFTEEELEPVEEDIEMSAYSAATSSTEVCPGARSVLPGLSCLVISSNT
jgi:hypothetical protein